MEMSSHVSISPDAAKWKISVCDTAENARHDSWGFMRWVWHWTCDESTLSPATVVTGSHIRSLSALNGRGVLSAQGCTSGSRWDLTMRYSVAAQQIDVTNGVDYILVWFADILWCEIHSAKELKKKKKPKHPDWSVVNKLLVLPGKHTDA